MSVLFEELKELIDGFKASNDARFADMKQRFEAMEAKTNRAEFGNPGTAQNDPEHSRAFNAFVRKGDIQAALSTGSDPDGGYLVPEQLENQIEKLLLNQSPMRRICTVIPINSPKYTKIVNTGGTASGWVGETEARPETATSTLAALTPHMGEIYANPAATQQMLDDSGFDVEALLTEGIADELAQQEGISFITGSGILKPKGILSYDIATTADATRPFGTLQYIKSGDASGFKAASATVSPADCLVDLLYSVRKPYRQGSVWLMNSNTLSVVSKFKDAVNGLPIWQRGLVEGQPSTLLGYAIEEDESMPDIGANALPIAFGNFKRAYHIVDRIGTRVLRDPYSNKPWIHFYSTRRVGAFLNNSQAVKLLKISA